MTYVNTYLFALETPIQNRKHHFNHLICSRSPSEGFADKPKANFLKLVSVSIVFYFLLEICNFFVHDQ